MKKTLILIISIFAMCSLFAQNDTIDAKIVTNYSYEKIGVKHYYTIVTTHADSSETVQRIPFKSKAEVLSFAKKQSEISDSLQATIAKEILTKEEYRKNLQDQIRQYNEVLTKEFTKINAELRALRTQRKLIIESKQKNNNVK